MIKMGSISLFPFWPFFPTPNDLMYSESWEPLNLNEQILLKKKTNKQKNTQKNPPQQKNLFRTSDSYLAKLCYCLQWIFESLKSQNYLFTLTISDQSSMFLKNVTEIYK